MTTETKTKTSVKEIAKTEIVSTLKELGNPLTTKNLHYSLLKYSGIKTSLDTVRKAVSELTEEKTILKSGDKKSGFTFSSAPIKKKRGWKSKLVRKLFKLKSGGKITRTTLAKMIHSDERNTHILVSCIKKNTDFGAKVIGWDKETKSYTY